MSGIFYVLDDHTPVPEPDLQAWGAWFEAADRHVCWSELHRAGADRIVISTVFVGLDMNVGASGPPIVFETMVFGVCELDKHQWRYASWEAAELGHAEIVAALSGVTSDSVA